MKLLYEIIRLIYEEFEPVLITIAYPTIQHIEVFEHVQRAGSLHRGTDALPAQCHQANDLQQPIRKFDLIIELHHMLGFIQLSKVWFCWQTTLTRVGVQRTGASQGQVCLREERFTIPLLAPRSLPEHRSESDQEHL